MAEEIRGRDLAGVQVHDSTFNGASFRDSDLRGVTIRALHSSRRSRFRELLAGLSDLSAERTGTPAPAWGEETHTVADCVDTLLREHTEHRRFAERDLASLSSDGEA